MKENEGARIGVLGRTNAIIKRAGAGLAEYGITVTFSDARNGEKSYVRAMTMHGAKGMEFTHVVLLVIGRSVLPQGYQIKGHARSEAEDVLQRERSLLYVAASRARDQLVITTHEELSGLLPH